ncbi:hypothetical protein [Halobaculum gomorrense]|uniref:DUF8116 domain-containing protein n=1 Tax=Halobaculum gomorrense TaxID=43928 RepID=A0A1M5JHY2_9EURY|nr:hypothetical protein [Halobaculum gomorrense]SHG40128.1 hypothetical protein SAMN05443636_0114 [Halobaculum gomorrense]
MTLLRLLAARGVADFAEWYRAGAEYTDRVADGMGFDRGGADATGADPLADPAEPVAALREGRTDVSPATARVIAATYSGDAAFCRPFLRYTPRWYRLALAAPVALAERRLRRVAAPFRVRAGAPSADGPTFTPPSGLAVGADAVAAVRDAGGFEAFERSFVLADAVLHTEWFAHVAAAAGIAVPGDLLDRTIRESAAYYTGGRDDLSPAVRRFQRLLFADDAWVRDIDTSYRLNSVLFGVWERILREERRRLERGSRR